MDPKFIKAKLIRGALGSESKCPLCREALAVEARGHCPSCKTPYHRACFAELGGCATLGCAAYRQPMKGAAPQSALACASCWEEAARLPSCPGCEVLVHDHCLEQEGCGSAGCEFQTPRARRTKRRPPSTHLSGATTDLIALGVLLTVPLVIFLAAIKVFLTTEFALISGAAIVGTGAFITISLRFSKG